MKASFAFAWLAAAALAGCTGKGEVEYAGDVHVASADLVTIEPGIQVVADADMPLFYVDGSYYLYRDGMWLRSSSYQGGFARVEHIPHRLREIDQPMAYVHFRAQAGRSYAERAPMPAEPVPQQQQEPLEQQPLAQPQPMPPQTPPQATPMPDQHPLPQSAQRNPSPGPQPIPQDDNRDKSD